MQNVEFKAELRDPLIARAQCGLLGARHVGILQQTDTYFKMGDGRLKKRVAPGEPTEWVFYHRENRLRPTLSNFSTLTDTQATRRWGTDQLRPWLVVSKRRELWLLNKTRIHLDHVDGLGSFIEFEAMVCDEQDERACHEVVARLREAFGPAMGEPISVSYSDLAAAEAESSS